jgi:nucleotide-binding universal stress UspA family protein
MDDLFAKPMNKPVLFCYDGSEGSRSALRVAAELVTRPADAVVLVVWMPAVVSLVRAGSFLTAIPDEGEIDEQEAAFAKRIAEEGAAGAREHGYNASARVARADASVVGTIGEIAQEIDAGLIVCGQRGRGAVRSALLGSVSHGLSVHAQRPVLIAPERAG